MTFSTSVQMPTAPLRIEPPKARRSIGPFDNLSPNNALVMKNGCEKQLRPSLMLLARVPRIPSGARSFSQKNRIGLFLTNVSFIDSHGKNKCPEFP